MAVIAFDATATGTINPATSLTFSHTCTGSNLVLLVGACTNHNGGNPNNVTGITYNGVALTKIDEVLKGGSDRWMSLWYLINPATGTHDVVVSTNTSDFIRAKSASYTGCAQTGVPDAHKTGTGVAVDPYTDSLASVADNCWHIFYVGNTTGAQGAGVGTTLRGVADAENIMDSNSAKTPAGSVTLAASLGSNGNWGDCMITLAPQVAVPINIDVTSSFTQGVKIV